MMEGGAPLEALARARTVMFDETGTLTVGGARLIAVETAPEQRPDEVLRLAASLEQASHNVVAAAIVSGARAKGLELEVPEFAHETMGSGIEGRVAGKLVKAGSHQLVCAHGRLEVGREHGNQFVGLHSCNRRCRVTDPSMQRTSSVMRQATARVVNRKCFQPQRLVSPAESDVRSPALGNPRGVGIRSAMNS
jgi:hypothetical protein